MYVRLGKKRYTHDFWTLQLSGPIDGPLGPALGSSVGLVSALPRRTFVHSLTSRSISNHSSNYRCWLGSQYRCWWQASWPPDHQWWPGWRSQQYLAWQYRKWLGSNHRPPECESDTLSLFFWLYSGCLNLCPFCPQRTVQRVLSAVYSEKMRHTWSKKKGEVFTESDVNISYLFILQLTVQHEVNPAAVHSDGGIQNALISILGQPPVGDYKKSGRCSDSLHIAATDEPTGWLQCS